MIDVSPAFSDSRGSITDLLNKVEIRHVGLITSKAGSIRGNHLHLKASQYIYVIRGRIELVCQEPDEDPSRITLDEGDFVLTGPGCAHAFRFVEDSELLVLTTEPRNDGGYEDDTIRLTNPLIA